ncbi:hypothetical protein [Vitiosangium sp. GDMCC 1.1324]|uniref:hypothetical protein n=1 Tax=Vitiosangium sp. (strain GDMCC 1.1324) TaxID=2138576 RepID=UPI000D3AE50B|nr:hypothetical protein [Vitiosangium sp. GDMCC 1.1324]PTL81573.1 hypothetical protein DAT35_21680 [Vitiosangium sp. GDMCC 1.1324]
MGICLDYVSLAEVPPMTLVRDRLTEKLGCPVSLVEHPAGFHVEVKPRLMISIVPGERVLEVRELIVDPEDPRYEHPAYLRLCRALTELGGKQTPVEPLDRMRFRQRFEFEGNTPAPLEVHEQLLRLGGRDIGPPSPYEPWFELMTTAPDAQTVVLDPQPPWLHMISGYTSAKLYSAVYNLLLSFGARLRPDDGTW